MKSCNAVQALAKLHEHSDFSFGRGLFQLFVPALKRLSDRQQQPYSWTYYQNAIGDELPVLGEVRTESGKAYLFIWPKQLLTFNPITEVFTPIPLSGIYYRLILGTERGISSRVVRDKDCSLAVQWD